MFDAFKNILGLQPGEWSQRVAYGAQRMGAKLAKESTIRIYVDNTPNFGNQASSVLLMQTLIDSYGFNGVNKSVWMVYKTQHETLTRDKLAVLIKGFDSSSPAATATYKGVTINFANIETGLAHAATVNFGFSGGADPFSGSDVNWFAANLKVNFFLRMQPYMWFGPEQIQYGNATPPFDFVEAGNKDTFRFRGWYVDPQYWAPSDADWTYYKNAGNYGVGADMARHVSLAESMLDFMGTHKHIRMMPVYGVKGPVNQMGVDPDQILPTVVAGALGGSAAEQPPCPVIVVTMNDNISDEQYRYSAQVSKGGMSKTETSAQAAYNANWQVAENLTLQLEAAQNSGAAAQEIQRIQRELQEAVKKETEAHQLLQKHLLAYTARKKWLDDRNAGTAVKFFSNKARPQGSDYAPGEFANALNWLVDATTAQPAILFVELGGLSTIIFNNVMACASYPRVFEGANTTNLSMNIGSCYFRMRDIQSTVKEYSLAYPSQGILGVATYNAAVTECYLAANAVILSLFSTQALPAAQFQTNLNQMLRFLDDYFVAQDATLVNYFDGLRDFYGEPLNGKVAIGLAYLNTLTPTIQLKDETPVQELATTHAISE